MMCRRAPRRPRITFWESMPRRRSPTSCETGSGSAHDLHFVGLNLKRDPDFARLAVGVLVLSEIFLGEGINVPRCALLGHVTHAATDLDVAIGIVGIEDRKRH